MKTLIFIISSLLFSFSENDTIRAKETDRTTLTYDISQYQDIRIHNFKGDVTIKAGNGNQLRLEITRTLTGKSSSKVNKAKEEVFLDSTVIDNEFIVFVNAPNRFFKIDDDGNSYYNGNNWENWSKNDIKDYGVEYEFTIIATLPANRNLYVGTHHKDIEVERVDGNLKAKNHHGNIKATTGGSEVYIKTHHGDIEVNHTNANVVEGYYKTHHGDIKTSFPEIAGTASFKSHHGAFYTDFNYNLAPAQINKASENKKTKFKIGGSTNVTFGNGKGNFEYKTHHGDTFITKS